MEENSEEEDKEGEEEKFEVILIFENCVRKLKVVYKDN